MKLTKQILTKLVKEEKGKLNEFNKAHFLNLIKQELQSKKGQLAYAEDNIRASSTPRWERKEWLNVAKDLKKEIKVLQIRVKKVMKMEEAKLNEEKYVVASIYGDLYTPKAVSEKKALKLMMKIADQYAGDKVFMLGVKAWNKPHKYNKKKIKVKEAKLTEGYDVSGYSKRLEKIYDEYGMVVGNLKTDLKNNGYKKESIELERAFGKFVYKFYMQTRNILRRTNEVKEGKLTEGIKRWKIYVKGQSKPFVVGADSSSKAKQLAHMMIKNSSIKIDKIVQEIVNEKHTVWRKTPHTGKIKKGMYVWFVDNRGTQRIKVKHIMKAKDGKDLYITNKGTFEEKDVAGY